MRNFKRKTLTLLVTIDGDPTELRLRPLTDAAIDRINAEFAAGAADTPEETTAKNVSRAYHVAAFMLGADAFESSGLTDQAEELREENGGYPRAVVLAIYQKGVEVYMAASAAIVEAAKDSVRPTESASPAGS